jgi:hypothetical protein
VSGGLSVYQEVQERLVTLDVSHSADGQ